MSTRTISSALPSRLLYTMIRVKDLDRSIEFYRDALGMHKLRRESFPEGRFTLAFIGYGNEASDTVIELTHNWDESNYNHGTGYGHLALSVDDVHAACKRLAGLGVKIVRDPGPMIFAAAESGHRDVIAFIEDPDGYRIELVESIVRRGLS